MLSSLLPPDTHSSSALPCPVGSVYPSPESFAAACLLDHHHLHPHHPELDMGAATHTSYPGSSGDAASVDFRAFYPYTPNEVKHRKRTTSTQLRRLEAVFKNDTKPNARKRIELAQELDMTARGVQVWFQNRRAKEKSKQGKLGASRLKPIKSQSENLQENDIDDDESSSRPQSNHEDDPVLTQSPPPADSLTPPDTTPDASVVHPSTPRVSPPKLHLVTDTSKSWSNPNDSQPPLREALHFIRSSNVLDLYARRRGSLPANMFPEPVYASHDAPSMSHFDPLARRRSVDASLQRLAHNPYAPYAKAKNDAVFGHRFGISLLARHQFDRVSYTGQPPRTGAAHHLPVPQRIGARRSSMDSRVFHQYAARGAMSSSPSPLPAYHDAPAALPEHKLYAVSSRAAAPLIPGPLPSPGYSFGAHTPSMASPSSADSENSPDSLRSFTYRGDDDNDDDDVGSPVSYTAYPRFGSTTSIATTDSLQSPYYPDLGGSGADLEYVKDLGRRDSCTSGQFLGLMSGLGMNNPNQVPADMNASVPGLSYAPNFPPSGHDDIGREGPAASYPSPSSTMSPRGSPHARDVSAGGVPISQSSELCYALHGHLDTGSLSPRAPSPRPTTLEATPSLSESLGSYYNQPLSDGSPASTTAALTIPPDYVDKYPGGVDAGSDGQQHQYAAPFQAFAVPGTEDLVALHQYGGGAPATDGMYAVYRDAGSNMTGLDSAAFASYSL